MGNVLESEDSLAFVIDLVRLVVVTRFEDSQVVRRFLDLGLWAFLVGASMRPVMPAVDRFEHRQAEVAARSVDQALVDPVEFFAAFEDQVPTLLGLEDRIVVLKAGLLLLVEVEAKAQAGRVDPSVANLRQAPYDVRVVQGFRDPVERVEIRAAGETVVLLGKLKALLGRLALDPFMPVEQDERAKGRMAAHPKGHVAPPRVHDVKGIVVDVRPRIFAPQVQTAFAEPLDGPNRSRRLRDLDQKHACVIGILG